MKSRLFLIAVLAFAPVVSHAQQQIQLSMGDVNIRKMDVEVQKTPNFTAGGVRDKNVPNPRDWLELEVEFEVKGRGDGVVPELQFRYYIGFTDANGRPRTLTGDVRHRNVPLGDRTFSAVYVAPSKLGEITGNFRRFSANSVAAVGVEVYYNGVLVGGDSSVRGKFWEQTGTEPGVLSKTQTPFALLWLDRYAEFDVSTAPR